MNRITESRLSSCCHRLLLHDRVKLHGRYMNVYWELFEAEAVSDTKNLCLFSWFCTDQTCQKSPNWSCSESYWLLKYQLFITFPQNPTSKWPNYPFNYKKHVLHRTTLSLAWSWFYSTCVIRLKGQRSNGSVLGAGEDKVHLVVIKYLSHKVKQTEQSMNMSGFTHSATTKYE